HMNAVKCYLHKYVEQLGPKVVFGDDSTYITEGYGSINVMDKPCSSCEKEKHHRATFKSKQVSSIKKCLHLLHMDLFRPVNPRSTNYEKYTLVIVDEYSRSTIVKRHLKTPYEIFHGRIPNIDFLHVFGCPVYIHNHKDYLGKFDEKLMMVISLVTYLFPKPITSHLMKALMLSNLQNLQMITSPLLKLKDTHQMSIFIHMNPLKADQNDYPAQDDEILNDDQSKHSNHNNDNHFIDNLLNTKDIQISEPISSSDEDASDKHIELVNIIGNPGVGMLTKAMSKELSAASAHECLFVDFLSVEEPKKVSEALKHPGWVDAMQQELNQFSRNKVWILVPAPYGKNHNWL
ncbi:retrovirus-related pol polyprotein from transposon TNT 1-94, partial [Tanacetum coccineum]